MRRLNPSVMGGVVGASLALLISFVPFLGAADAVGRFDHFYLKGNRVVALTGSRTVTLRTDSLFWMAGTCESSGAWGADWHYHTEATDAPTASCQNTTSFATLNFDDAATETIYRDWWIPLDWNASTITADIVWYATVTSGSVVWQLQTFCTAANETMDASTWTFNTAQTVTDAANPSASTMNTVQIAPVTTTGCAAGELLHLKLLRNPAHASDTLGNTALLVGVRWTY